MRLPKSLVERRRAVDEEIFRHEFTLYDAVILVDAVIASDVSKTDFIRNNGCG